MQRREVLKSAAGLTILRSGMLRGQTAPSNRLNIALIGVWGRGTAHYNVMRNENVVALCDVNDLRTKEALAVKKREGVTLGKPKGTIQKSKFDRDLTRIRELLSYGVSVRKIAEILGYTNHLALNTYINKRKLRESGVE